MSGALFMINSVRGDCRMNFGSNNHCNDKDITDGPKSLFKIRIGAPAEFFVQKALDMLCKVECQYEIKFGLASDLLGQLQGDKVDCVIATKQYEISDIEYIKLEEEEFVLVVPPHQVVPSHLDSIEGWLEQQRWISYGKEFPIIRRVWKQHFHKKISIKPFHIIPDLRGILKSIEMGMGMSLLPSYLIQESVQDEKSKVIFPELLVKNQLYLACKTDNRHTPYIQKVLKELSTNGLVSKT